jgi:hypothetical protein
MSWLKKNLEMDSVINLESAKSVNWYRIMG